MCLAFMAAGDTLVVPSLDRLSRSLHDLITIVGGLRETPCARGTYGWKVPGATPTPPAT